MSTFQMPKTGMEFYVYNLYPVFKKKTVFHAKKKKNAQPSMQSHRAFEQW